jgi:predicted DsbA family dithiol-disulfide isomerase
MSATPVHVWVDPSCPWAWQAHVWLDDLRRRGEVELTYGLFSLEVNASEPGIAFAEAAPRYGHALACLALARREGGNSAVTALYTSMGRRLHDDGRPIEPGLVEDAAREAGLGDLATRATPEWLGPDLLEEYRAARALDVFGVPTLRIGSGKPMYGPILALGPTGEDGLRLWRAVAELLGRDAFFEMKRWPRDLRPGGAPTGDTT